jgi:1-deoxy-D-xylulose-5-phosphate reductoisomerase
MNKILEVIEASLIFNLPLNKFKIIIHPQSLIHAIVEFRNGLSSMLYHNNDMKIPIANSLYNNFYIHKEVNNKFFSKNLSFYNPTIDKFPSIKILSQKKILNEIGYILITVLNEILVERFLNNRILFTDIVYKLLEILKSKVVINYLKNNKIRHINDVYNTYNFSRSLLN